MYVFLIALFAIILKDKTLTSIQFYHLTTTKLDQALPKLLGKALSAGFKICVKTQTKERVKFLDQLLWTYTQESFLPHGTINDDKHQDKQPIFITDEDTNPNQASILITVDDADEENVESFERVLTVFDGNMEASLQKAREKWKIYKEKEFELKYFKQTSSGSWEEQKI